MADTTGKKDNNGTKFFGLILVMVGTLTSIWLMLDQRLDNLTDDLKACNIRLSDAISKGLEHKQETGQRFEGIGEQLREKGTQLDAIRDTSNMTLSELERKIDYLWQEVTGSDYPSRTYWPYTVGEED